MCGCSSSFLFIIAILVGLYEEQGLRQLYRGYISVRGEMMTYSLDNLHHTRPEAMHCL